MILVSSFNEETLKVGRFNEVSNISKTLGSVYAIKAS